MYICICIYINLSRIIVYDHTEYYIKNTRSSPIPEVKLG